MSRLLITGATGFLGSEIVRQAVAAGHQVVAMRRSTSVVKGLAGLPIEWREADVTNPSSLRAAMRGVQFCIHTAGDTSYFLRDQARQVAVNVKGVRNVIEAALGAEVRRMVHTSSVAAIGFDPAGGHATEESPFNWPSGLPYMETKREGKALALGAASPKFEVICLNPATVLGPGTMNASEELLIRDVRREAVPAVPSGGITLCDVADVARAHLVALDRGRSRQRYILGGPSVTHGQLIEALATAFGVRPPRRTVPGWALGLAGSGLYLWEKLGFQLETPAAMVRLARFPIYHASDKAIAELDYRPRPLAELIARVVQDKIRQAPGAPASGPAPAS